MRFPRSPTRSTARKGSDSAQGAGPSLASSASVSTSPASNARPFRTQLYGSPTVVFEDKTSGAQLIQEAAGMAYWTCGVQARTQDKIPHHQCPAALALRRASEAGADLALGPAAPLGRKPWKQRSRLARSAPTAEVRGSNPLSSTRKSARAPAVSSSQTALAGLGRNPALDAAIVMLGAQASSGRLWRARPDREALSMRNRR